MIGILNSNIGKKIPNINLNDGDSVSSSLYINNRLQNRNQ